MGNLVRTRRSRRRLDSAANVNPSTVKLPTAPGRTPARCSFSTRNFHRWRVIFSKNQAPGCPPSLRLKKFPVVLRPQKLTIMEEGTDRFAACHIKTGQAIRVQSHGPKPAPRRLRV